MFAIPHSLARAGSDVMATISATSSVFTNAAESLSYLTQAGSAHAEAYLDNTKAQIAETNIRRQVIRVEEAKVDCARRLIHLQRELDQDPDLAAAYAALDDESFSLLKPKAVAP
jgi:hypothetical protein